MLKRTVRRLSVLCALVAVLSGCVPDAPSGLVVRAVSSSSIALSWHSVSTMSSGSEYYIYRKTIYDSDYTLVARVNHTSTSYTDTGLSANTTYYYRVSAYDDDYGEGDWSDSNYATTWP
jgi:fibronectin type 3 domain-containing protein